MTTINDVGSIGSGRDSRAGTAVAIRIEVAVTLALVLALATLASRPAAAARLSGVAGRLDGALHFGLLASRSRTGPLVTCSFNDKHLAGSCAAGVFDKAGIAQG